MLRCYKSHMDMLVEVDRDAIETIPDLVWIDLLHPTSAEIGLVETLLSITMPTQAEMAEIELSSRLYSEDGAEFMTMTALSGLDTEDPAKAEITFVIKERVLVTVRFADPRPFNAYLTRALRPRAIPCATGTEVFLGLLESLTDRTADALEKLGNEIDQVSRHVFRRKSTSAEKFQRDLRSVIEQIGMKAELLTMIQESLVSISRLTAYHGAAIAEGGKAARDARQMGKLVQRDALSLGEHARTLTNKLNFLLDATLGLINLEQNQIIKIFSVVAVVLLPPTLVGSIYGMNFDIMPELHWDFGYPLSLGLMVVSAILPYLYFKRRGWL
ncbi:magnesium transporter CorA family protein [Devosia faecipullorum]|uniref:magnesium transporter CorA family protein n=1 Tax=Devosia faecipullorum TaxID=2755039 RepID=UPI00187B544E|nr:magnesium transporter CorA family protein [Devosia faecipullorum]MBE7732253.1 magnesium transporter CorA family protein [Devosia faecipullorum]